MGKRSQNEYPRRLKAAAALLLCVLLTGTLLFHQMVGYTAVDPRQYIPLTRSNGITHVVAGKEGGEFRQVAAFDPNRPVVLAASPFLTASWFRVTDKDQVWKGDTHVEIFRVSYENDQQQITVKSSNGEKIIAPGTENSYTFALENTAEGAVDFHIQMKVYFSHDDYPIPVEASVRRDMDNAYLMGGRNSFEPVLGLNYVEDEGFLTEGYVIPYTLTWQWPFEGDDAYDTLLGNPALEEDLTLTIVIETTASYAPPESSGGIPKTGDTSHIQLAFTVMVGSGAALLLLLLLGRRKREDYEEA